MCNCDSTITTTTNICQEPVNCSCPALLSSSCVNNVDVDLQCSNILKGQTLSEVLVLLDAYICTKFDSVTNFFQLINVGTGSEIYKGVNMLGKKEIRTLIDSGLINIVQGTNDITISVDEVALNTFIEANQKTYSATNIGTGASIYKDNTIVGDNTQFNLRKIKSSNSSVSIVQGADDIDITVSAAVIPDGSETIVTAGTNVSVTGTGTIATPYVINAATIDGTETKVVAGANTSVTGTGTTATPYTIDSQYSPIERLDEGNGNGYVVRGRNSTFYGSVGQDAFDLSYSDIVSSTYGATGESSFNTGIYNISNGYNSSTFGYLNYNNSTGGFVTGTNNSGTGYLNSIFGAGHDVTGTNTTVVGQASNIITASTLSSNIGTDPAFVVGNGTFTEPDTDYGVATRSDALIVKKNGLATLPSVTNSLISLEPTGKAIVTKEYLNLQKFITYPADFTGIDYTVTNSDMGYSIIILNGATAVNIIIPIGLTPKMQVGFIQDGGGEVSIVGQEGVTIMNAIAGYKIKGQYDQAFIEQGITDGDYYLLGNTRV